MADTNGLLFLVVCAASPARHIDALIRPLRAGGWRLRVFATADGAQWLSAAQIEQLTGDKLYCNVADLAGASAPQPDAVIIAPMTFHTANQIAAGANNTLALNVVHDAIGSGLAVIAAPHVNGALKAHPLHQRGLATLRILRVHVVDDDACEGGCAAERHWPAVLAGIDAAIAQNG